MKNENLYKRSPASLPSVPSTSGAGKKGDEDRSALSQHGKSEKGIALVMVLVMSAIMLMLMTALIYMITVGTQSSGLLKRYKTALEAGYASTDIMTQVIAVREESKDNTTFQSRFDALKSNLSAFGMNAYVPTVLSGCTGTTKDGVVYTGMAAKVMTSTASGWQTGCNSSLDLVPADESTYDLKFNMGTSPRFTVYAKIINTIEGNTSGDSSDSGGRTGRRGAGVVSSGTGELPVMPLSSVYTIEVAAEGTSNERVKLQILYQY